MTFFNLKYPLILVLICFFTNISKAQLLEGKYLGKNDSYCAILTLEDNGWFELLIDGNDCSPNYIYIGEGNYQTVKDSLVLKFNLLPPNGRKSQKYWTNTIVKIRLTSICELQFQAFDLKRENCLLDDIKEETKAY